MEASPPNNFWGLKTEKSRKSRSVHSWLGITRSIAGWVLLATSCQPGLPTSKTACLVLRFSLLLFLFRTFILYDILWNIHFYFYLGGQSVSISFSGSPLTVQLYSGIACFPCDGMAFLFIIAHNLCGMLCREFPVTESSGGQKTLASCVQVSFSHVQPFTQPSITHSTTSTDFHRTTRLYSTENRPLTRYSLYIILETPLASGLTVAPNLSIRSQRCGLIVELVPAVGKDILFRQWDHSEV